MALILKKHQVGIVIFSLFLFSFQSSAQRIFVNTIGGVNRSFLYYSNSSTNDYRSSRPVVIILHKSGETAREAFAKTVWKYIKEPTILIFPNAVNKIWDCKDEASADHDIEFLKFILEDTYNNFHHDRNRVFIFSEKSSECIAQKFRQKYPKLLNDYQTWIQTNKNDSLSALGSVQSLLEKTVKTDTTYSLWDNPAVRKKMDPIDSLKEYRLHNRVILEVRYGGFAMLGSVHTGITDGTYAKLYNAHSFLDIHLTKWMNDSIAWFIDIGRLKVPQTQETTAGGSLRTGGGMVMPLTIGLKYALPRVRAHPYFLLGSGVVQVLVFGGKMSPGAVSSGARPNLNSEVRMVFHTTIGTGIDLRFAKRFTLGANLRYIHSANFESAGKVDAIRGFNLNVGLGYIINANSLKKLPFPLSNKK
ncbi:hypothetical protein ACFP1I_08375 [Dyadobacter subterraneus]|uniref:Outer membrane protein beta-barrel domain-containing protein n=1 Tax=Dyadobacter subterraneus TaxID=2773304 RepID=A0ABR9WI63_9BACT|nr:hypothetical protein [Dyadobacter subterraneus]MBE9463849.1 hypothetical protein [Dyadobacter subterraneus]